MKSKVYLFVSLLLVLLTSCTQDSMDDDLSDEEVSLEQIFEDAALSDYELACYDAEDFGIVPNGECLIGAIMKAGEQFNVHWNYGQVKLLVDNYLHKPSIDYNGNIIGFPSDPKTLEIFLHTFFDRAQRALLDNSMVRSYIGKKLTAIAIVKNHDKQNTGHAYNVLRPCNEHKDNCYICYDPVAGSEVHIKSSEFAINFAFILEGPKSTPNLDR